MMEWVMAAVALGATAGACALVARLVRARDEQRLRTGLYGAAMAADGPGIAVLCSGVRQVGQIENLLATELTDYEVIATVDAAHYPVCFETLVNRYAMIRVESVPSDEFPGADVRSMWRSRKRCFRRLVLLDRAAATPAEDYAAAASVAAYEWLLPVRAGDFLLPGAMERLAVRLDGMQPGSVAVVRTRIGVPCMAVSREAVAAAGGFGGRFWRKVSRRKRRSLWEPLLWRPHAARRGRMRRMRWPAALLLGGGIVAAGIAGHWAAAMLLAAGAVVWCASALATQLADEMADAGERDASDGSGKRCELSVKNFTLL